MDPTTPTDEQPGTAGPDAATANGADAQPLAEPPAGFHALALDVLSGRPRPRGSAPELEDAYEVWAYRHDPDAVVIVRSFEQGGVTAIAAFAPAALGTDERFAGAVERLVALRVGDTGGGRGLLSDLVLLEPRPAYERVARALACRAAHEGVERFAALHGEPDEITCDYLDALEALDPDVPDGPLEAGDGDLPFESLADLIFADPEGLRWTGARERTRSERVEVLTHVAEPQMTVLLYFPPGGERPQTAVYLPTLSDDARHETLLNDVAKMLQARDLNGPEPSALPVGGRFRRLGPERALEQVEISCDALAAEEGCAHEFAIGELGPELLD